MDCKHTGLHDTMTYPWLWIRMKPAHVAPMDIQQPYIHSWLHTSGTDGEAILFLQVSSNAQTEYLKALAERCAAKQQQTEEALWQKYLKLLNPNAKKLTKADMEEHMAKVQLQRLFQGQGVVDKQ